MNFILPMMPALSKTAVMHWGTAPLSPVLVSTDTKRKIVCRFIFLSVLRPKRKTPRSASWFVAKKRCQTKTKPANELALRGQSVFGAGGSRFALLLAPWLAKVQSWNACVTVCRNEKLSYEMVFFCRVRPCTMLSAGTIPKKMASSWRTQYYKGEYHLCAMCLPFCEFAKYLSGWPCSMKPLSAVDKHS
jgi:hypothetical protein